ncbi:MAG: sensor histidine kinase [Sphingobacteriaceae bacterium]
MIVSRKFFKYQWTYKYGNAVLTGCIVALLIACFELTFYSLTLLGSLGILLFCCIHALAMTTVISCYTETLNPRISQRWIKVPALFLMAISGTLMATYLSYYVFSRFSHHYYDIGILLNQAITNFSVCIIISALVLLYESQRITYINQFQKKEIEILRMKQLKVKEELETLQSKINPHFLYNSLNAIASLVYTDAVLAEELTLKLSKLFRYSINYSEQNFSTLAEELEMLEVYLAIEKIRLGPKLQVNLAVADDLLPYYIPRFLIQPLVENALKHGLSTQAEPGFIKLCIQREGKDKLLLQVFDSGQAFPQQITEGNGFMNTNEKLQLLFPLNYQFQLLNTPQKHVRIVFPCVSKPIKI